MGIRFFCPNGHKLNVKAFLAGQKGICPYCGVKVDIPLESTRGSARTPAGNDHPQEAVAAVSAAPSPLMQNPVEPMTAPVSPSFATPMAASQPAPIVQSVVATPAVSSPAVPSPVSVSPIAASPMSAAPAPTPSASGPADPLSEAPDAVWYVRPPSGGQYGPAASSVMRSWLQEGRISGDSLVWREGWRDWQEALGVFPQLRGDDLAMVHAVMPTVTPSAVPTPAVTIPPATPRRPPRSMQVIIVAALVLVVIVLFGVFLWILYRGDPAESADASRPSGPRTAAVRLVVDRSCGTEYS